MDTILDEISDEFNIRVVKVDVARNPYVSQMFGITSVPTIIFMRNRKVRETVWGKPNKKDLVSIIKKM
jgi:thioredoxin-like negative regulator of GroEL